MKLLTLQFSKAISFGSVPVGDFTWREKGDGRETDTTLLGLAIPPELCGVFRFVFNPRRKLPLRYFSLKVLLTDT